MNIDLVGGALLRGAGSAGNGLSGSERAAQSVEAHFLSHMLKSAGLAKPLSGFGGGAGEAQFASLLVDEQARIMASNGGIGLAPHLMKSMRPSGE